VIPGLFSSATHPIGVEIAVDRVRLLQLKRTRGSLTVAAAAQASVPNLYELQASERRQAVAKAVNRALSLESFAGRNCIAAIPMDDIELHSMRVPPMPDEELARAVRYEANDRFGVDVSKAEVEFVRLGEVRQGEEARQEIILVVAPHRSIIDYLDALTDANLRPVAAETPFSACARCYGRLYRRTVDADKVRMILHIGADRSEVLVMRGNQIGFHRGIEFGGVHLDRAVADLLSLSLEESRELRRRRMSGEADLDHTIARSLREATRPVLADLVHEAALSQRYYSVTFRGSVPEHIVLSGENALEPDLLEITYDELKVQTVVGQPFEHIDVGEVLLGADRRSGHPDWATPVGLSLRGEKARASGQAPSPADAGDAAAREAA
jgi:type IV pilus assembly protein PilM